MAELISLNEAREEPEKDWEAEFESCTLDLNQKIERPPLAISIGRDDVAYKGVYYPLRFGTYGNISLIKGEEKSRKSFFKSLIEACSIGGRANNFCDDVEIQGHNMMGKWVISIDGEQGDYDCWLNGKRIPEMVGTSYDKYKLIALRKKSKPERLSILEWLFTKSPYKNNLGFVFIDGYVDFISDFNDLKECDAFATKLGNWSANCDCHISGILHVNPGSEKARGHAGTIIQQKCETVVTIKDMGDYSKVVCNSARGKKFPDFTIRVDDNWLPYVSEDAEETIM